MVKVVWTEQAIDDLNNIANYHSKYSDNFTSVLVQKLFNRVKVLAQMPEIGRVVPEKADTTIRELIEGNYRIIYNYVNHKNIVAILAVHHSSQPIL